MIGREQGNPMAQDYPESDESVDLAALIAETYPGLRGIYVSKDAYDRLWALLDAEDER